jgi:hypothetical protein
MTMHVVALCFIICVSATLPGVHTPLFIEPIVDIPDSHWLLNVYTIVLNRTADGAGFRNFFAQMQNGMSRVAVFDSITHSAEFSSRPLLSNRTLFVRRAYWTLLARQPTPLELQSILAVLRGALGNGHGNTTWPQLLEQVYMSREYHSRCPNEYFTLNARVNVNATLLRDLFTGKFRFQPANESDIVQLTVPSASKLWDQKLPIVENPNAAVDGFRFVALTRVWQSLSFTIAVLQSNDGLNFTEVGLVWPFQR